MKKSKITLNCHGLFGKSGLKEVDVMKKTIGLCIMMGMLLLCGAAKADVLLSEDWSSNDFATNGWTVVGDHWYAEFEEAVFWYEPAIQLYEQSLTSKVLDGTGFGSVWLDYDILLHNYSTDTVEEFAVCVGDGSTCKQVAYYNNQDGSFMWIHESIDISEYASDALQVQFTAFGEDSWNIAGWYLDNIEITAESATPPPTADLVIDGGENATDVGDLNLTYDAGVFNVDYSVDAPWEIVETHVYIGDDLPKKSAPGTFPYQEGEIEFTPEGDSVCIAAYAEVRMDTGDVDENGNPVYIYEGMWAQADVNITIGKGGNWATCFIYELP
jgi:hypothetical protein